MSQTVTDVFESFDTSIVSDALDQHGIDGVINGIEPTHPDHSTVGRAHTLRLERANNPGTDTNFPYAMLHELVADRVLVMEGVDPSISCWGGNASKLAANAGMNGIVIEGGYRDIPDIRAGSIPVFGRSPTPKSGQQRLVVEEIDSPIEVDGIEVAPDDLIVADATGIVVVPADDIEAVAETAEGILGEELLVETKIDSGATVPDLESDDHEF